MFYCFYCHYNICIQGFIVSTVTTTFGFKVLLFLMSLQHLDSRFHCFYYHYNIWIQGFIVSIVTKTFGFKVLIFGKKILFYSELRIS